MPKRSPRASTEILSSDREAKAVELRAQGWTFQKIAEELGYSDQTGASKAYHRALRRRPAQNVDQLREQEASRLEFLWQKTAEIVENPPYAYSSIARTIPDPDFPVDPDNRSISLAGKYIKDESVRLRAAAEYRKQSESFRKLTGIDIGTPTEISGKLSEELQQWADEYRRAINRERELEQENAVLRGQVARLEAELRQWEDGSLRRAVLG